MAESVLRWFNSGGDDVEAALRACCDVPRWISAVVDGRPYSSLSSIHATADAVARTFTTVEVDHALTAHPRIGERAAGSGASAAWSRQEQAAALDDATGAATLEQVNRAYEDRFGRTFLICASGRTATEVVAAARQRLGNDDETELEVVADQLRQIALLRLRALTDADRRHDAQNTPAGCSATAAS